MMEAAERLLQEELHRQKEKEDEERARLEKEQIENERKRIDMQNKLREEKERLQAEEQERQKQENIDLWAAGEMQQMIVQMQEQKRIEQKEDLEEIK